ncbi:MAG: hypothetical protein RQ754_05295 [Desulfuromonadales bacterium]|nr:hypothetical protein [Desulfuromonadales bacterium]
MNVTEFSIRKKFLFPLGLVLLLSIILLVLCILQQQPLAKILILTTVLVPVAILFVESSLRRVRLEEEALIVQKLFRSKRLVYTDITSVDTVRVKRRAFLSISTEPDFVILSNSYADFAVLLEELLKRVPESAISAETRQLAEAPPTKSGDIFSAWLAAGLLLLILYAQLGGEF